MHSQKRKHYVVKKVEGAVQVIKQYRTLDDAIFQYQILVRAAEDKPVSVWVLSTERDLADGDTLDDAD